ncbi:hypothetical protein [Kitasatospora sp. MBT63]|uniref:hypothetical protein n=1 Tax=Kitasatospora sp. MBT63 TaxID=1444768 RepID=UPI00053967FF|nr:hypothetical protein [Kitasatospora sp. MBT63]
MADRPTVHWREGLAREARALAAGTLDPAEAYVSQLFPDSLLSRTDEVLAAFEAELGGWAGPSDGQVLGAVERVVLALNAVNDEHGGGYETDERERLCDYIDASLAGAGVDVGALAGRHGLGRYEITDRWREW